MRTLSWIGIVALTSLLVVGVPALAAAHQGSGSASGEPGEHAHASHPHHQAGKQRPLTRKQAQRLARKRLAAELESGAAIDTLRCRRRGPARFVCKAAGRYAPDNSTATNPASGDDPTSGDDPNAADPGTGDTTRRTRRPPTPAPPIPARAMALTPVRAMAEPGSARTPGPPR